MISAIRVSEDLYIALFSIIIDEIFVLKLIRIGPEDFPALFGSIVGAVICNHASLFHDDEGLRTT
jgi:hypothetical protein